MIVDYLIKNNDIQCFRVLINRCLHELSKLSCDIINIGPHTDESFKQELLKNFAFHSPIRFPYRMFISGMKYYFHVYNCCPQLSAELESYVYDENNWHVTYASADNM